jgi:hypothetical protein
MTTVWATVLVMTSEGDRQAVRVQAPAARGGGHADAAPACQGAPGLLGLKSGPGVGDGHGSPPVPANDPLAEADAKVSGWEPTKAGGLRRTGVAQRQSTGQITRRSVSRKHPPVLIKLRERLGLPECPYVTRWRIEFPFGSVRVHHWSGPDDPRAFHDHPWWFVTFVVKGAYADVSPRGRDLVKAPAVRFRKAEHRHTVQPFPGGAWTVLITGKPARAWGFWHDQKFIKANKWFATAGHHTCDSSASIGQGGVVSDGRR